MGLKHKNLCNLRDRGLNTHTFMLINTVDLARGITRFVANNSRGTFRADRDYDIQDLPFMLYDANTTLASSYINFMKKCVEAGCSVVASNGAAYDDDQLANVVVILKGTDVLIEVSELPVPLRHMYRHSNSLCSLRGTTADKVKDFSVIGHMRKICHSDLERLLNKIYEVKKPSETVFECTLYPFPVGVLSDTIIFWQAF